MLEDRLLIRRFKSGNSDALRRIYEKYEGYLLTLATAFLGDVNAAEDVMHDVFCSFIQNRESFRLQGNLKCYLGTCVANLARDRLRSLKRQSLGADVIKSSITNADGADNVVISCEESRELFCALTQLPYQQREAIILHLRGGMKFKQIADMQRVSINTVKSRYRYGLDKLRLLLNSEVNKNEIERKHKEVN